MAHLRPRLFIWQRRARGYRWPLLLLMKRDMSYIVLPSNFARFMRMFDCGVMLLLKEYNNSVYGTSAAALAVAVARK